VSVSAAQVAVGHGAFQWASVDGRHVGLIVAVLHLERMSGLGVQHVSTL
jgi:hypothetical protein